MLRLCKVPPVIQETLARPPYTRCSRGKTPPMKESSFSCYWCGHPAHEAAQSPYKEAKCHACGRVGHLKKVCHQAVKGDKSQKQAKVKRVEDATSDTSPHLTTAEYYLFWTGKPGAKPFEVTMLLDGHSHNMEIDTGASVSVMSQSTCQQLFGERKLERTSIELKTYSDEQLKVVGQLMVHAGAPWWRGSSIDFSGSCWCRSKSPLGVIGSHSCVWIGKPFIDCRSGH